MLTPPPPYTINESVQRYIFSFVPDCWKRNTERCRANKYSVRGRGGTNIQIYTVRFIKPYRNPVNKCTELRQGFMKLPRVRDKCMLRILTSDIKTQQYRFPLPAKKKLLVFFIIVCILSLLDMISLFFSSIASILAEIN